MERQIGSDHWFAALSRLRSNATLKYCFVKGDYEMTCGSTESFNPENIKDTTWEYVVERWPEGLACVTYNFGNKVSWVVHV